eukprot:TRINITY_DN29550_c0_g1_i1.p1 TRINITY_DN29550_c0_g1~~TRINITY_DN29550_c0_g1_i1.p1  ORF type:complete len:1127 (-),score=154.54 TRINITY_DN29550_c0_g1_i1:278-3658(-)
MTDRTGGHTVRLLCSGAGALAVSGAAVAAAALMWRRWGQKNHTAAVMLRPHRNGWIMGEQGISWAEVARHTKMTDAWLVIHGAVYDVTDWIGKHPGGELLLLALAGLDASKDFDMVGHSMLAKRELKGLYKGFLLQDIAVGEGKSSAPQREAFLTGGWKLPRDEVGAKNDGTPLWDVNQNGFLPSRDPVSVGSLFGTPFEAFARITDLLPTLVVTGEFCEYLDGNPELQSQMLACSSQNVIAALTVDQTERAFSVVGYIMVAYWRTDPVDYTAADCIAAAKNVGHRERASLPRFISAPMLALSERLNRPPMIDYASTVLYNWVRIDPNGPISTENIACPLRLTGLLDEEWFFKTHVVIEAEAAQAVSAINLAMNEWDGSALLKHLDDLEEALFRVVRACLPLMYERDESGTPKCSEHIFYQTLRPLIMSGVLDFSDGMVPQGSMLVSETVMFEPGEIGFDTKDGIVTWVRGGQALEKKIQIGWILHEVDGSTFDDSLLAKKMQGTVPYKVAFKLPGLRKLNGPSGAMSSLLPCIDAALGVEMTSERLKMTLSDFENSTPREHRSFLCALRRTVPIRERIRGFERSVDDVEQSQYNALARAFNRCIARVLDFRWQHWQYVKHFIMKPGNLSYGVGSGGTSFDFLQQHITDTERARLTEKGNDDDFLVLTSCMSLSAGKLSYGVSASSHSFPKQEFWSVDGEHGLLGREPLFHGRGVILPDNIAPAVRQACQALCDLAVQMPALLLQCDTFRKHCERAAELLEPLQNEGTLRRLPETVQEALMTILCFVARGCANRASDTPPKCIRFPLRIVANSVGRPARLDFTGLVLTNWVATQERLERPTRENESDGVSKSSRVMAQEGALLPRAAPAWRFLASPDERSYIAIEVLLHHDASEMIRLIRVGQVAMRDQNDKGVVDSMVKLSIWLNHFCNVFDAFFERWDSRVASVMMRRLSKYIAPSGFSRKEVACWICLNGSSVLFPAICAFLGLSTLRSRTGNDEHTKNHPDNDQLFDMLRRVAAESRSCTPRLHSDFLESLEKPSASVRHHCLRRFGSNKSVETLHDLEVGYSDALNALIRFFSRRVRSVNRLFPEMSGGFSALEAEIRDSIQQSRLQLLKMRRRLARSLEK